MTKENCSTCSFYNKEQGSCSNEFISSVKDAFTKNDACFMDYKVHKDDVFFVGKLFMCELYKPE